MLQGTAAGTIFATWPLSLMSILVINTFAEPQDRRSLRAVSSRIGDLINQARTSQRPVAHLHQKRDRPASGLRVPIGRYEPVFRAQDLISGDVPEALFDFIVNSPTNTIELVGAASRDQIDKIRGLLDVAGYSAQVEPSAIVETSEES